jgi:uncharacterized protein
MIYDSLPYDQWIEEALRGVIRQAIEHTAEHGLPGDHHFYVTFRTDCEGVEMAPELRAAHPEEMTIVLQHQFWDLEVDGASFAVKLKFHGKTYRLQVPIAAVTAFGDPSVNFGLQLKRIVVGENGDDSEVGTTPVHGGPKATAGQDANALARDGDKTGTGEVVTLDNFRKK